MRTLFALTLTAALIAMQPMAGAQQQQPSQQDKMKTCNSQASSQSLTGDARKSFMSSCLKSTSGSGSSSSTAGMSQQDKMKACNTQASSQQLKGDARQSFMSTCLKGQ